MLVCLHFDFDPMDAPRDGDMSKYNVALKWRLERPDPNHVGDQALQEAVKEPKKKEEPKKEE